MLSNIIILPFCKEEFPRAIMSLSKPVVVNAGFEEDVWASFGDVGGDVGVARFIQVHYTHSKLPMPNLF